LGLQSVVVITYQYTGSLVLAHVTSIAELGYFQAAARLTSSLNIVGTSVSVAAFPLFVSMWRQKDPALAAAYYRSIKYLLAVGLGVAAGTTVLAAKIVAFLYGSRFEHAIAPLRILVWSEALVFWGFISASLLLACDRRWELSIQAVATAVFGVAASVSMVYVWGVPGAATGMLSTEAFATGLLIWQLKRTGIALPRRLVRDVALGSVASCCMIIILFATSNLHLLVQVVLGALTYGVVLCALGYFDTYDIARLSNILGFRRSTGLIQR
jgi:O-antigen/teichoic acid export membrane protein